MLIDKIALLAAIDALPDATPVEGVDPLQAALDAAKAQVADLQKQLSDAQAALAAEVALEASDADKIAALGLKISNAMAALNA